MENYRKTDGGIIQGSSHTCQVLNHKNRNKIIVKAVCNLRKMTDEFDSIACCGVSGLMVVPQIAELLNKNIVVVRKTDTKSYSDFIIEGVAPFRYIIIDDLICSGATIRYINNIIKEEYPRANCVGAYFYMPYECAYTENTANLFERDFKTILLNPAPSKT